jgi:hypothetical protein
MHASWRLIKLYKPVAWSFEIQSLLSLQMATTTSWSPKDLTNFWPPHQIAEPLRNRYLSKVYFEGKDSFDGWRFQVHKPTGKYREWSIPPHYANPLALISAKIIWLQAFRSRKHQPKDPDRQRNLKRMRDDNLRTLIFTVDVRRSFLKDVVQTFYGKGHPRRSYTDQDSVFRSQTLDSWLYTEYTTGTHKKEYLDPLSLSLDGKAVLHGH